MTNARKYSNLPYNKNLQAKARQLRKSGNLSEVLLWQEIKNKKLLNLDFDRQRIIGHYIVDFFCKDLGVIIEIDGSSHDNKASYDKKREDYLRRLNLIIIHILDADVKRNMAGVLEFLKIEIKKATPS